MKLEDAMDAAILLYSLWAGHKSDYLQVPSLAVWVRSSDDPAKFMGGAAAASAIEEVATQQVQLAALQAAWRRVVSAACVNEMADAKKAFRGGNALANAYIEAEVKAAAAAKKHTAAIAPESKASAEVEAASAKVRELANQASGGPSAEPNKEEQALTRALAAKQEALAKKSAAAVAPKAAAEAAAAELAAAKEEASAGTKAALELGEEWAAAAFTALRRGYDEYAHSASGLLSSPDLQDSIALYKPTDDGAAAAAAAAAGTLEAEAAQAEGSEQAAHARVASLLVGIDMAERGVSKAVAALRAWQRVNGHATLLGPKAVDEKDVYRGEAGVLGALMTLVSADGDARRVISSCLMADRRDVEARFAADPDLDPSGEHGASGMGPIAAFAARAEAFLATLAPLRLQSKVWLEQHKSMVQLRRTIEDKTADADTGEDSAPPPPRSPPTTPRAKAAAAAAAGCAGGRQQPACSRRPLRQASTSSVRFGR